MRNLSHERDQQSASDVGDRISFTLRPGAQASTFPSAAELTSWVGTCPGKDESAEQNHSSRSAKGNKYLRRVLNQAAHAAVKRKDTFHRSSRVLLS
jgi:transposase